MTETSGSGTSLQLRAVQLIIAAATRVARAARRLQALGGRAIQQIRPGGSPSDSDQAAIGNVPKPVPIAAPQNTPTTAAKKAPAKKAPAKSAPAKKAPAKKAPGKKAPAKKASAKKASAKKAPAKKAPAKKAPAKKAAAAQAPAAPRKAALVKKAAKKANETPSQKIPGTTTRSGTGKAADLAGDSPRPAKGPAKG